MIRIFIPSYNRAASLSTPHLLDDCGVRGYKVVVRPSQYKAYAAVLPKSNLLVLPSEGALNAAREYTRTLLKRGEWCLHIDDDMLGFIAPKPQFYKQHSEVPLASGETMVTRAKWQPTMNVPTTFAQLYEMVIEDTMREADKRGAYLCGFAAWDNPAFRRRKFTDVGYVCGGMMLMRNQGLPWSQTDESSCEDYALSAAHLFENGRVLINKWAYPRSVIYQQGGCGTYEERLPSMLRAQQSLCKRYGRLLAAKNAGVEGKRQGELRIRMHSLEQVEQWRYELIHDGIDPNLRTTKGKAAAR